MAFFAIVLIAADSPADTVTVTVWMTTIAAVVQPATPRPPVPTEGPSFTAINFLAVLRLHAAVVLEPVQYVHSPHWHHPRLHPVCIVMEAIRVLACHMHNQLTPTRTEWIASRSLQNRRHTVLMYSWALGPLPQ